MDSLKVYSIIGLLLYFILLIVIVLRDKKAKNTEDYFFGGRKLPFFALSLTFIASWFGAGSFLSTADMAYKDGMGAFFYYGAPVLVSTFFMIILSKFIRRVGYLTQGEMIEERYDKKSALLVSIMIFLFMTFSAASQMVGIGDFFGNYLGIDYKAAIILGTLIVFIYSLFGGFRGVVITDIIQFIFLTVANVVIFLVAMKNVGGFSNMNAALIAINKAEMLNPLNGFTKYLPYIITFGASWAIQANVWQRISGTKNEKDAKKMTIMSFFIYIPLYLIIVFTGMASVLLFKEVPEGGVVIGLINGYMGPFLSAVMFIGLSSAIMSTMDSLINTGAMTCTIDIYKGFININASEERLLKISRYSTCIVTFIAFIVSVRIPSILDISVIASDIITTGVFIPLLFGFFFRRGNSKGAFCSMLFGSIFSMYNFFIKIGLVKEVFYEAGSVSGVLVGIGFSLLIYLGVSFLTKPEYEKADDFIDRAKRGEKVKKDNYQLD